LIKFLSYKTPSQNNIKEEENSSKNSVEIKTSTKNNNAEDNESRNKRLRRSSENLKALEKNKSVTKNSEKKGQVLKEKIIDNIEDIKILKAEKEKSGKNRIYIVTLNSEDEWTLYDKNIPDPDKLDMNISEKIQKEIEFIVFIQELAEFNLFFIC